MIRSILYLLRIAPGYDVADMDGIPGKDFGPNWISGLLFYLYRLKWCRDEYVRVEYFFEYVHYLTEEDMNIPEEEFLVVVEVDHDRPENEGTRIHGPCSKDEADAFVSGAEYANDSALVVKARAEGGA